MALVTGGETFLGMRVARALLKCRSEVVVTLLCRPDRELAVRQWVDSLPPEEATRCRIEHGMVNGIDLGLSADVYRQLTREVDQVFHVDELGDRYASVRRLQTRNVEGTREILEFAGRASRLSRFVHFSTVEVSGSRTGVVLESELDAGQGFLDAYQKTKFEAERLVARWARRIPVTVLRPGLVVGDTQHGEMDPGGEAYAVIRAMLSEAPSRCRAPFNVVPWDFFTEFAARVAADPGAVGRVYHVTDPAPLPLQEVGRLLRRLSHRSKERSTLPALVSLAFKRLPIVGRMTHGGHTRLPAHLETMVFYSTRNTLATCRRLGFFCPPFDEYAPRLVGFLRDREEARRRRKPAREIPDPLA